MEDLLKQLANYGFPAVVAAYVLVRLEPIIRNLEKSVTVLTAVVAKSAGMNLDDIKEAAGKC